MCNLSQGIKEDGIAIGEAIGEARGEARGEAKIKQIILNMHRKGLCIEEIAAITDKDIESVKAIIEGKEPVLA